MSLLHSEATECFDFSSYGGGVQVVTVAGGYIYMGLAPASESTMVNFSSFRLAPAEEKIKNKLIAIEIRFIPHAQFDLFKSAAKDSDQSVGLRSAGD
jgi:hypothetical protein